MNANIYTEEDQELLKHITPDPNLNKNIYDGQYLADHSKNEYGTPKSKKIKGNFSGETKSETTPPFKRRRHKNSRLGCEECKTRRIRCDNTLKLILGDVYTCLNCLLKWQRATKIENKSGFEDNIGSFRSKIPYKPFCSFSSLSSEEIERLQNELNTKDLLNHNLLVSQNLYPIYQVQKCVNIKEEEDPELVTIEKVFEIPMMPHKKVNIKVPKIENNEKIGSEVTISEICVAALLFSNEETVNYYISFALNAYVAKLRKMYISNLKGVDALYEEANDIFNVSSDSMSSFSRLERNREFFERKLELFNKNLSFEEKQSLVLKCVRESEKFIKTKITLSYRAIGSLFNFIVNNKNLISPSLIINCLAGGYSLRSFELFSLGTDDGSMKRYVEHYCSFFEILCQFYQLTFTNTSQLNNFHFQNINSIAEKGTYKSNIANKYDAVNGRVKELNYIDFFLNQNHKHGNANECSNLSSILFNQSYIHMKNYSVDCFFEITKMLMDFGSLFILSANDDEIDSVLKEDFKNLVLFLEHLKKISVFIDFEKALPLQPNLLWQLTNKLLKIKPIKLLNITKNGYMSKETLTKIFNKHNISQQSFSKFGQKVIVNDYNKLGLVTPVERVLYSFYFLVDLTLVNCFSSKLFVFEHETYGSFLRSCCSFETLILDLNELLEVDKKLLFFCNYAYRLISYMYKRKDLMADYFCLNSFYSHECLKTKAQSAPVTKTSESFLQQPCYKARVAFNIKEKQINSFLTTRLCKENFFQIDYSKPIPLELIIAFKNGYQQIQEYSFEGLNVLDNGHYWNGNFYLIHKGTYFKFKKKLVDLYSQYGREFEFYFKFEDDFKNLDRGFYTYFKKLGRHDIFKLALRDLPGTYTYQEKIVISEELDDIETTLQNLVIVFKKHNEMPAYFQVRERTLSFLQLHPIIPKCRSETFSSSSVESSKRNSNLSPTISMSGVEKSIPITNLTHSFNSKNEIFDVLGEHKSSKLSFSTGLFHTDYAPTLSTCAEEYKLCCINSSEKNNRFENMAEIQSGNNNKRLSAEACQTLVFNSLVPNLDFIKMVRKDKTTLLFDDGRDIEDH